MATFWATCTLDLPWSPAFCLLRRPRGRSELQNVTKTNGFSLISKSPKGPPETSRGPPIAPAKHPQAPQAPAMERQGGPKRPPRVPRDPKGPPQRDPKDAQATPRDPKDLPRDLQEAPRDLQGPPRTPEGHQKPSKGPLVVDFGTVKPLSMARPSGMRGAIKNIKHINTIGLAVAKAAANPIVCRGLILFCTHRFLGLAMLYIYIQIFNRSAHSAGPGHG